MSETEMLNHELLRLRHIERLYEALARAECRRQAIDPDDAIADGGHLAWHVIGYEAAVREMPEITNPTARRSAHARCARCGPLEDEVARLQEIKLLDHDQYEVSDKLTDLQNERDWALADLEKLRAHVKERDNG